MSRRRYSQNTRDTHNSQAFFPNIVFKLRATNRINRFSLSDEVTMAFELQRGDVRFIAHVFLAGSYLALFRHLPYPQAITSPRDSPCNAIQALYIIDILP